MPASPPPPAPEPTGDAIPTADEWARKFPGRTITPEQLAEYTAHSLVQVETYHHTHESVAPKILADGIRMEALGGVYGKGFYVSTQHETAYGPAYLTVAYDVRNPFRGSIDEINRKMAELTEGIEYPGCDVIRDAFLKAGYDGVILDWGRQIPGDEDAVGRLWVVIMQPENCRFVVPPGGTGVGTHDENPWGIR